MKMNVSKHSGRRGRTAIATLAATAAMVGGVQALAPASAVAMPARCERLLSTAEMYYALHGSQNALFQYYWNRFMSCMGA